MTKYLIVGEVVFLLLSFMARKGEIRQDMSIRLCCGAAALSVVMWPLTVAIFVCVVFKALRE